MARGRSGSRGTARASAAPPGPPRARATMRAPCVPHPARPPFCQKRRCPPPTIPTAAAARGSPRSSTRCAPSIPATSAARCRRSARPTRARDRRARAGHARRQCERPPVHRRLRRASCSTRRCTRTDSRRGRWRRRATTASRSSAAASPTRSNACRRATSRRPRKCATATAISPPISRALPAGGAILALGRIAHDATLRALGRRRVGVRVRARRAASRSTRRRAVRQLPLQPLQHEHRAPHAGDVPRRVRRASPRISAAADRGMREVRAA